MALPDHLPDPIDDLEDNRPPDARPSWLVGPDEVPEPLTPGAPGSAPAPELRRLAPDRVGLPLESRQAPAPAGPVAWTAAGNSVPRLTQVPEIERRGRAGTAEPDGEVEALPDDGPALGEGPAPLRAAPAPVLNEPWWIVLAERVAGDRRLLVGIGIALVVAIGAWALWPRSSASVRLREIQRHPDRWEGRSVQVDGRVGDVFPIGSGYVFQLHQGRDTIVVFTRTRVPERRQRVQVAGEVSAGYLDGRARLAILEHTTTP